MSSRVIGVDKKGAISQLCCNVITKQINAIKTASQKLKQKSQSSILEIYLNFFMSHISRNSYLKPVLDRTNITNATSNATVNV